MTTYNYSLSGDFPTGAILVGQFQDEILAEAGITVTLIGVEVDGDDVDVIFTGPLSGPEVLLLDAVVAAHIPGSTAGSVNPTGAIVSIFTLINRCSPTSNSYVDVGRVVWNATRYANFTEGTCVFTTNIGSGAIDIQIWDSVNAVELGTVNSFVSENGTFTVDNPESDTEIFIRVRRSVLTGTVPTLDTLTLQFLN